MKIDDKRQVREFKRELKRQGHKRVRARVREMLHSDPEGLSARDEDDYGELSSAHIHVDATPDDT